MHRSGIALVGAIGGLLVGLATSALKVRRLQEELRVCREDARLIERRVSACRDELRAAQMLE